jgi:alpha-galactosidase
VRDLHHADPTPVAHADELRSEWVTVLADADARHAPILVGFDAGTTHDGTIRVRRAGGGVEVRVEAFLGGCVLAPGTVRTLHAVVVDDRPEEAIGAGERLERWATRVGRHGGARIAAPYRTGWCSWYHYFHDVTEADLRANLARAAEWPFDVFQLDDGFQHAIGDWLRTNRRFPSGIDGVARLIAAAGCQPGLWIAPFLVAPDSEVARTHPEWLARDAAGDDPLLGMLNPPWGGGRDGWMYVLDTTQAGVQEHLADLARSLVMAGYTYLKLDFTYAAGLAGRFADPSRTPAERVRDGFAAIRRGAGEATFLLACGAPLAPTVGLVDGMRIGPDVAPRWALPPERALVPAYADCEPATRHAFRNTLARAFMHRQLWLNDPDCLMLRATSTELSPVASRTWAHAVAVSGGMALVSDDLAQLDASARAAFDEVIAIGRASDAAAAAGRPARTPDLLDRTVPGRLDAAGWQLDADPDTAASALRRGTP